MSEQREALAEEAFWREQEAGNTMRDRGGYFHAGFVAGYKAAPKEIGDELRELAREAAEIYDQTIDSANAASIGSVERRLHTALGDLAHAVLTPGAGDRVRAEEDDRG